MLDTHFRSFEYAWKGVMLAWHEERNFQTDILCGAAAVVAGLLLGISGIEWLFLIGWIALVLAAEAFNTALEELCDMLRPTHDPHVAKIKDLAAAAVLMTAAGAFVTGCIIFLPKIFFLL